MSRCPPGECRDCDRDREPSNGAEEVASLRAKLDAATVRLEAALRALEYTNRGIVGGGDFYGLRDAALSLDPIPGVALLRAARELAEAHEATYGHYTNREAIESAEARLARARDALLAARRAEIGGKP